MSSYNTSDPAVSSEASSPLGCMLRENGQTKGLNRCEVSFEPELLCESGIVVGGAEGGREGHVRVLKMVN